MEKSLNRLARLAGGVLLVFGVGLAVLSVFIVERQLHIRGSLEKMALIFIGVSSLISLVCLVVGYRLALDRPNLYQSVLSPLAWFVLAVAFSAIAAFLFVVGSQSLDTSRGGVFAALFSLQCIFAWRAALKRGSGQNAL